jgi:hypothetical protein
MATGAVEAAEPVPRRKRTPRPEGLDKGSHSFLEQRFFLVGLIWLLFTIGLVSYVIFGPPLCSSLKIKTFTTVLSLAAGFLAWTFSGSIKAQARNLVPGIAIAATGGFAVFVVLQFQLKQEDMRTIDPRCTTSRQDEAVSSYFTEIAVHTSNVVQRLTEAKHNPALNQQVVDEALTLKTKIDSFPKGELDDLQKGVLFLYGAQASTALALTLPPVVSNARDARTYLKDAAAYAESSSDQLTKIMSRPDDTGKAAADHVAKYKSLYKAKYLLGIARMLEAQWAQVGGAKAEYSNAEISAPFKDLPATFLKDISAASDPPVKWFCSVERKELAPCNKL